MNAAPNPSSSTARTNRSDRFLATLAPFGRVVLSSHINPDPDALASMLGLEALLNRRQPGKPVVLTFDGIIARAENQAMVDLLEIPLTPIDRANRVKLSRARTRPATTSPSISAAGDTPFTNICSREASPSKPVTGHSAAK